MQKALSKSKRGPALFDLLGENELRRASANKPTGWVGAAPVATEVMSVPALEPAPPVDRSPTFHTPSADAAAKAPFFELDGDRVRLSLTSISSAVVLFVGLVLLFGIYELGRRSGERSGFRAGHAAAAITTSPKAADPSSPIELARSQPPATHLVNSLLKESPMSKPTSPVSAAQGSAPVAAGSWTTGQTYIVVQEFAGGRDADASRAQEFLAAHGIETGPVKLSSGAILLLTRQGYNHKDLGQKQQSDQFLQKVRSVGAKYFASGGGYKLEGYYRTRKADGW